MVTRSRSRRGGLVALNHLIWHGVGADVGNGIVSSRGSMPISQSVTPSITQSISQSAPRFGKERRGVHGWGKERGRPGGG